MRMSDTPPSASSHNAAAQHMQLVLRASASGRLGKPADFRLNRCSREERRVVGVIVSAVQEALLVVELRSSAEAGSR